MNSLIDEYFKQLRGLIYVIHMADFTVLIYTVHIHYQGCNCHKKGAIVLFVGKMSMRIIWVCEFAAIYGGLFETIYYYLVELINLT